jgi:hypothetical protein
LYTGIFTNGTNQTFQYVNTVAGNFGLSGDISVNNSAIPQSTGLPPVLQINSNQYQSPNALTNATFECWVKIPSIFSSGSYPTYQIIVGNNSTWGIAYQNNTNNNNNLYLYTGGSLTSTNAFYSNFFANIWHHLAITFSTTTNSTIYVDGSAVYQTTNISLQFPFYIGSNTNVLITNVSNYAFYGLMYQARLWNTRLQLSDISNCISNSFLNNQTINNSYPNIIMYMNFDKNNYNLITNNDISANLFNGNALTYVQNIPNYTYLSYYDNNLKQFDKFIISGAPTPAYTNYYQNGNYYSCYIITTGTQIINFTNLGNRQVSLLLVGNGNDGNGGGSGAGGDGGAGGQYLIIPTITLNNNDKMTFSNIGSVSCTVSITGSNVLYTPSSIGSISGGAGGTGGTGGTYTGLVGTSSGGAGNAGNAGISGSTINNINGFNNSYFSTYYFSYGGCGGGGAVVQNSKNSRKYYGGAGGTNGISNGGGGGSAGLGGSGGSGNGGSGTAGQDVGTTTGPGSYGAGANPLYNVYGSGGGGGGGGTGAAGSYGTGGAGVAILTIQQ